MHYQMKNLWSLGFYVSKSNTETLQGIIRDVWNLWTHEFLVGRGMFFPPLLSHLFNIKWGLFVWRKPLSCVFNFKLVRSRKEVHVFAEVSLDVWLPVCCILCMLLVFLISIIVYFIYLLEKKTDLKWPRIIAGGLLCRENYRSLYINVL